MFYEGRQIGSYTLLRKLGRGGFGEVWLAEKRSQFVTKKVAVKLPLDDQINFDAIRQEATLWEQASGHANVLPIIDADVIDGQVVIVSEYASGGSLADRLKREGKLSLQKTVEMTIGILSGLEFLHSRHIIHRDIKPQNILLQGDTPRLADFGISRAMNTTVISSAIIGTDAYMSPESFDGKRNVQTDIWSVGVVLYALLADRLPFPQEHPSERMFAILTKEFETLPTEVPQNLQRIVAKALAKQPENRYQTTAEMREELQRVLVGIAHPTFAKTEVLRIPPENLPTVSTVEEKRETVEAKKENVVSPQNVNLPPPTVEFPFQQESVVTSFKESPTATNEPAFSPTQEVNKPPPQFQMYDKPLSSSSPASSSGSRRKTAGKSMNLMYAIGGMVVLFFLVSLVIIINRIISSPNASNRTNFTNSNTSSNIASKTNSSTNSAANQSTLSPLAGRTIPRRFKSGDKYGLFDIVSRKTLVEPKFEFVGGLTENLIPIGLDGKCGFMDETGNIVIQPKFDSSVVDETVCEIEFSEGLAAVRTGGREGYIDKMGNFVIPPRFYEADPFSEGLASVKLGGKWGFIDKTGNFVIPNKYPTASGFVEGMARVCNNSKCGFIDKTGNLAIPLQFDAVSYFSEGLAEYQVGDYPSVQWGYLDKTGNVVIPAKYYATNPFSEGRAVVKTDTFSSVKFIDKTGNEINFANGTLGGFQEINKFLDDLALVKDSLGKYGYIDRSGKIIIKPKYDNASSFKEGVANVKLGDKILYIDKNGTEYPEP